MWPRFNPNYDFKIFSSAFKNKHSIEEYEAQFAKEMGQTHALYFPYGRTSLIAILNSLDLNDREIICPAYTCVVVPHAVVFSNNKPVFVDSQKLDFNMDLDAAEAMITEKTGALIATSIFGYPVDTEKLKQIKKRFPHLHIIQDCAHSFSCEWKKNKVNIAGECAFYGLNISKIIDSVFGGMITTDNNHLYHSLKKERARLTTPPSLSKSVKRRIYFLLVLITFRPFFYFFIYWLTKSPFFSFLVNYYDESKIDMPKDYLEMPSAFEAGVGIAQLKKYSSKIETRRNVADYYDCHLSNRPDFIKPPIIHGATYSHYVVLVRDREAIRRFLLKKGVQLGEIIEYSIPEMKSYATDQLFPNAGQWKDQTINLPVYSIDVAKKTVKYIKEFHEK